MLYESVQCYICSVICFAPTDLYLQQMNIKVNVVCKTAKNFIWEICVLYWNIPFLSHFSQNWITLLMINNN
jgi:hypothetical protein